MRLVDLHRQTDADGTYRFYPIGDLHLDHVTFNQDRFLQYREWIISDPYAVAVFVGDLAEGRVPGQKHFDPDSIRPYFQRRMSNYYDAVVQGGMKLLGPIARAGVPLVVVRGNHDRKSEWYNLAKNLTRNIKGAQYLGDGGFARITSGTTLTGVGGAKRRPSQYVTKAFITHGSGGGKTPGPKINNMEMGSRWLDDINIICKGHVHDAFARVVDRACVPDDGKLELLRKPLGLLRAPAFVEHLVPDTDGYVIQQEYPTTDRGLLYLNVKPATGDLWRRECEF